MKIDPYKHKERYFSWKEKVRNGIPNLSEFNSNLIKQYVEDMEHGINVSNVSVKGSRSFIRLNSIRDKMCFFAKKLKEIYNLDRITDITEEQLCKFFSEMRSGTIKRKDGKDYRSVAEFVKDFKSFWHWYQKVNRKKGIEVNDITIDLDSRKDKPEWVYLEPEKIKVLFDNAKYNYKVLFWFLYDSGIRSPTELVNVKVSDLVIDSKDKGKLRLNIRDEISKGKLGRPVKLMLCSDLLKEYIKLKNLKEDDFLFPINQTVANRYLQRLTKRLFGENKSLAGSKYSEMTLYDFRHLSACYWLNIYKSESLLKRRFGWKNTEKIF